MNLFYLKKKNYFCHFFLRRGHRSSIRGFLGPKVFPVSEQYQTDNTPDTVILFIIFNFFNLHENFFKFNQPAFFSIKTQFNNISVFV